MKLQRATGLTPRPLPESSLAAHPADQRIRRVEASEGLAGDRERSLQQEMAEVEAAAIGAFQGGEQVRQEAREVAAQLVALGAASDGLIKPAGLPAFIHGVDASA